MFSVCVCVRVCACVWQELTVECDGLRNDLDVARVRYEAAERSAEARLAVDASPPHHHADDGHDAALVTMELLREDAESRVVELSEDLRRRGAAVDALTAELTAVHAAAASALELHASATLSLQQDLKVCGTGGCRTRVSLYLGAVSSGSPPLTALVVVTTRRR